MNRPSLIAALIAAVAACGGGSSGPIVPEGQHYYYVANQVFVPTNNNQAREYGLDLDGNGTADNQLGMVLGTLSGMGFDIQGTIDKAILGGSIILLVDFQTKDFNNTSAAGLQVYLGTNPNPPACNTGEMVTCTGTPEVCTGCGHHLTGSAMFTVAPNSPMNAALAGKIVNGTFNGGPGDLTLQIALGGTDAITLDLIGARAKASSISATAIGTGTGASTSGGAILAGALTQDDLNNKVIPAIQTQLIPIIHRDCCGCTGVGVPTADCTAASPGGACPAAGTNPVCGCTSGSTGATILGLFDGDYTGDPGPKDCAVSVDEIKMNSLIQSLLAPDVTIEGKQALSLGIKVTTVGGQFTP
jgi:hypothetical protein